MSDKCTLAQIEETRLAYLAGTLLKEIAAGLSARKFEFETSEGTLTINVPKDVEIDYKAETKTKEGIRKNKLEIEISWKEPVA